MRFLHCSDLHISQNYLSVSAASLGWRRTLAMLELTIGGRARAYHHAQQTLSQIVTEGQLLGVDQFVITGDITAYSAKQEFSMVRETLGDLAGDSSRCAIVPGNHDCFTANADRDGRFEREFAALTGTDFPEYCVDRGYPFARLVGDEAAIVGLRSGRLPRFPGVAWGEVGSVQLNALQAILHDSRLDRRAILILVHHAPRTRAGRADSYLHGLRDGEELLTHLRGPRFAVLHGHLHERFHHDATPSSPHIFCAGSSTLLGHEGYWLIDVRDGEIADFSMHVPRLPFPR